jgi:hypothetical protein
MSSAFNARAHLDANAANQAFSHLSRMHASSAAAFFAGFFAYLAYAVFYVLQLGPHVTGGLKHLVLLGVPALAPVFLGARYWSANTALKNVAEDIRVCSHPWTVQANAECEHPTLHSYVVSKYSAWWRAVTQRAVLHWLLLLLAALLLALFACTFWQAAAEVRPNP